MSEFIDEFSVRAQEAFDRELHAFQERQSSTSLATDTVGRILRAHLVVEIRLREHLQVLNPNLGPLEELRLTFDNLVGLYAGLKNFSLPWLVGPIKTLNKIRNQLAHRLNAEIQHEHVDAMARLVTMFMKLERQTLRDDPAMTIELFSMLLSVVFASVEASVAYQDDLAQQMRAIEEEGRRLTEEYLDASNHMYARKASDEA